MFCVVVVTSVTALLSKQTLKELYSKYCASQSQNVQIPKKMIRFWAQIPNVLFSFSIPEKVNTLNWKWIRKFYNKKDTLILRETIPNCMVPTKAQNILFKRKVKQYCRITHNVLLLIPIKGRTYLCFHWRDQSLDHSACPKAAMIQMKNVSKKSVTKKWMKELHVQQLQQ